MISAHLISRLNSRCTVLAFFAALVAFQPAVAQEKTENKTRDKTVSAVGNWTWEIKSKSGTNNGRLTIKERDGKLVGTYSDTQQNLKIKYAQFKDGQLTFRVNPIIDNKRTLAEFSGKVTADSIKGKLSGANANNNQDINARRMSDIEAIAGTWRIEFATPDGSEIEFEFKVTTKNKKIKIEFIDDETVEIKKVSFKKGTLSFESDQEYQRMALEVVYFLDIDGDDITGTLEYAFIDQDQEGELEVVGQRIK